MTTFLQRRTQSANQIGDPRMDSGAPLPEGERQLEFDPFTPLLPEEVCWILDRAMACEVNADDGLYGVIHACSSLYIRNLLDALARRQRARSDGLHLFVYAPPGVD